MEEPTYIKNMRELRKQAHYTQEEVSQKLNIQRQTYSNYENEWRQPPLDIIIRLAELYHVSTDYLLLGSEPGTITSVIPEEVHTVFSDCHPDTPLNRVSDNISKENSVNCEHLSQAAQSLLREFYALSREEQAQVRNIIQSQEPHSAHLSIHSTAVPPAAQYLPL